MKQTSGTRRLTQLALLAALLLVMNFTPLGYLQVGPLSMSLMSIPVAIGAMLMGPVDGAILGGVFGATSFLQAVQGTSAMGAALFASGKKDGKTAKKFLGIVLIVVGALGALTNLLPMLNSFPWLVVGLPAITSFYFDWFTGVIQAFIFCTLTTIFIKQAAGD